jgi:signal transduction histidine kinase
MWRRCAARERELLRLLADMARVTSRLPDARQQVVEAELQLLEADADALLVPSDGALVASHTSGVPIPRLRIPSDHPDSVVARAYRDQRLVFVRRRPVLELQALRGVGARALLAVPVTRVGIRLGVSLWIWRAARRRPSLRERRLAGMLGDEKGQSIQRAEMFAQAVDLARSQVRLRLARDLHDSVAQELAVLRLYAGTAAGALQKPEALADVLPLLETHAGKAHEEMRRLLDTLRAGHTLIELSVSDLVDGLVADFRQRCRQIRVTVEIPGDGFDVRPSVRETIYFVLREALNNAAEHSHASAVRVQTRADPDRVTLLVEDDGRGFDPAEPHEGRLGLVGMRERAQLAGGRLEIRSAPGTGTTVRLQLEHPYGRSG